MTSTIKSKVYKTIERLKDSPILRLIYFFISGGVAYLRFKRRLLSHNFDGLHYRDLWALSYFSKGSFLRIKSEVINWNKEKISQKGHCKVGFVVHTVSMWSVEGLYRELQENTFFTPVVLIVPYASKTVNDETKKYFQGKGYNVVSYDDPAFEVVTFDVIVYTHPYVADEHNVNILSLKLNKLVSYVSYSYILSARIEKLDMPVYVLSWLFFCESDFYKKLVESKSRVYSNNAIFCGYPKMDVFFYPNYSSNLAINKNEKKIIIFAPHQSVNYSGVKSATFELNGWFMLFLAEKYKDNIFWIVKPHPLLRLHSVEAGIFNSVEGYDDYLNRWKDTGTGMVIENGDYFDVFRESDAMITDSISFLAEYQYTGNPLLLLESGKQTYNEFGNSIRNILYRCRGNEYAEIEQFVLDVINEKDTMKNVRLDFFNKHLTYGNSDDKIACHNIYNLFCNELKA